MINKVEGPGGVRGVGVTRKAGKASGPGASSFSQHLSDDGVGATQAATGMSGAAAVTGLVGLQEVEDATERAARGKKRGSQLLLQLDELRLALLSGTLTKEQLLRLSALVQSQRAGIDDPGLAQILDDIDLRARVELAKYGF